MKQRELSIIVSTGVIGALIIFATGAALSYFKVDCEKSDKTPAIIVDLCKLLEAHNGRPAAAALLVGATVSLALFARAALDPQLRKLGI
jgi:CDP-diacylglycerol pyrophosphatase